MPELPEVETTARGLNRLIPDQFIREMRIYDDRLRWPVDHALVNIVEGCVFGQVTRRSKYLLLPLLAKGRGKKIKEPVDKGQLMIHLGMSGRLQVVSKYTPREKHSHLDWLLESGDILRYTDPRRFGSVHWVQPNSVHPLLEKLGPEPLTRSFHWQYLYKASRKRQQAIKVFIMNAHIVVGVGNIYANEALFRSRINPLMPAGEITETQAQLLTAEIKSTLKAAIKAGGTTLRDFQSSEGKPGYFKQALLVYGRQGEPCMQCKATIECVRLGQRATYYCPKCQH